jgi:hypothetical protein
MKSIICIGIFITIIIVGWIWFRPFLIKIWNNRKEGFSIENIEDPVFLFNILFETSEHNGNPQLNWNIPYKDSISSIEKRQEFLRKITSEGVSFNSRIIKIQTSAGLPDGHISGLKTTGLTTIVCDRDHYCLPGSTVTIKGVPGIEGSYTNGVSLIGYSNEKRDNFNRIDASYDSTYAKGSALGFLHVFQLIKDTKDMESIQEGENKGYLKTIPPEATVEVTHKVYKMMPYNEWLSCVLATMCYLYGPISNTAITGYSTDSKGTVVEDWAQLVEKSSYSIDCKSKNVYNLEPMHMLVDNKSRLKKMKYSLSSRNWINDPYHIVDLFQSKYPSYVGDIFNLSISRDIFGPVNSINIIPILHYLKPGSVKNIYWGLSGTGSKTLEQQFICQGLNLFNVEQKSIVGGTQLEGRLFDWVNPYDYESVKKGRSYPDPQTWIILGGNNTEDGQDRKLCYLDHYCGIFKNEFTNNKKIGYIFLSSFSFINKIAAGTANYFSGELPIGFEQFKSNEFVKAQYALMRVLSVMMKYLVSEEKCESIVIDIRANNDEEYSMTLASFFGAKRNGTRNVKVRNDTGFSFPLRTDTSEMEEAFATILVDLADTFPGCVFRGTKDEHRKVVILMSSGTTTIFPNYFLGDKGNLDIGDFTYTSFIGSKSLGPISKIMLAGLNTPTLSSKTKVSLKYSFVTGDVRMYTVSDGPLFNKPLYSDGFWNQLYMTSQPPNSLRSISGGMSLRNDMDLLYYSLGLISPPNDLFIKYDGYKDPQTEDPTTWKDPWLEQSIRESISDIIKMDISSVYPSFELDKNTSCIIINQTNFVIGNGQEIFNTLTWDPSQFNLQINFIIESGILQFNSKDTENIFIGFFNENNKPQYGVNISAEMNISGLYLVNFFIGDIVNYVSTEITFPVSINILVQENNQIYFTVNGYNMYQGNVNTVLNKSLKFGARCSNNITNKKSVITIKEFSFQ